jgi:hypothetical protein
VLADVVEYARVVVAEQPSQSGGEGDPAEVHGEIDTVEGEDSTTKQPKRKQRTTGLE